MKTKLSGIKSFAIQMELPSNTYIPKESQTSISKLRKIIHAISRSKRDSADVSKLEIILETINLVNQNNGMATKISQETNTLLICVRFNDSNLAREFKHSLPEGIKITGIGFKFLTEIDPSYEQPANANLHDMKKILESIDEKFYTIVGANGGIITKCYFSNNYNISTWVLFSKAKLAKRFLTSLRDNT